MLQRLRSYIASKGDDVHELVALSAFGKQLRAEYQDHEMEVPKWLDENLKAINREIDFRNADAVESKLNELLNRKESLKSTAEKRADLDAQIAKLQKKKKAIGA